MSGHIRLLSNWHSPVFLINSRLGLFTAAPTLTSGRRFSRSYAPILPSSLAMNLSSALEYSSQPPVSVYGTGRNDRFSWRHLRWIITLAVASVYYPLCRVQRTIPSVRTNSGAPSLSTHCGYGNINPLSIHCPFRVRVRSRLTPG